MGFLDLGEGKAGKEGKTTQEDEQEQTSKSDFFFSMKGIEL